MQLRSIVSASILATLALAGPANANPLDKAVAPITMKPEWLGYAMTSDFSNTTATHAIEAPIVSRPANAFNSEAVVLGTDVSVSAALSGYGVTINGAASSSKRFAMYRVYKISRIDELDMQKARINPGTPGFVPTRIYYGWALYVLVEGDASSFSTDVSATIFKVEAKVKASASTWGVNARVSLRGLDTKIPNEVVIPQNADDIVNKFHVSNTAAQPILVDYEAVGNPATKTIAWNAFAEPAMQPFDRYWASYRIYRDPRVAPGMLRVRVTNRHPRDNADFEIFKRGDGNHTHRWALGGSQAAEATIPVPTWPMNLVWVGHRTLPYSGNLDGQSGWTLDWVRIK